MTNAQVIWAEAIEARLGSATQPPIDTYEQHGHVRECDIREGRWDITLDNGSGFAVIPSQFPWKKLHIQPPQVGDHVTVYTHHGSDLVGFDLRGERVFKWSEREMNLRWLTIRARMKREEAQHA